MWIQFPRVILPATFQHLLHILFFFEQSLDKKAELEKSMKALNETERQFQNMDSLLPQNFQIQDPDSFFQVPQQQKEPIDLEKSIEALIQCQNDFNQSINTQEL